MLILAGSVLFAQEEPPAPGPAPEIQMAKSQRIELPNGLKVILVENHKLPRVAFQLYVNYDPVVEGEKAGMLSAMGSLLEQGTAKQDEEAFAKSVDMIGAFMFTSARGGYIQGLSKHKDKLASLLAEATLQPAFPEAAFEREVKQQLSGLAASNEDINAISGRVTNALVYGKDHPYGEFETEESWKNISLEDIRGFYDSHFKPNISYLVMVGDLNPAQAEKLAKDNFGGWQRGEVQELDYKVPAIPDSRYVAMVDRSNAAQSIVKVTYPVELKRGDKDIFAANVLNQILGGGATGRLFQNLREEHAFTYGAYSSLSSNERVGKFTAAAPVRTAATDSAVQEILNEMERIRQNPVSAEELDGAKNSLMGEFARSLEDPQTIASFALSIDRFGLEKDYYETWLKKMAAVTVEDVQRAARRFMHPDRAIVSVVGKGSEIADGLAAFGEVHYFDKYANKMEAPKRELPAGLSAKDVISKYIVVRGGKSKMESIKDMRMEYSASMMGQTVEMVQKMVPAKGMMSQRLEVGDALFVQKTVTNGKEGYSSDPQNGKKMLDGPELRKTIRQANPFSFINYEEEGYSVELAALEQVEGKDAFVLKVTDPEGEVSNQYYDASSGLLIQIVKETENAMGQKGSSVTQLLDYKAIEGVQFPHTIKQQMGPQAITFKLEDAKVNIGLKKKDFPVE